MSLNTHLTVPRRRFVRAVLLATGYSSVAGLDQLTSLTDLLASDIPYPAGTFVLKLDDFPALKQDLGSVIISVPDIPDIIVTRTSGNEFYAVTSVCTHQGCTVGIYDPNEGALVCPCHHSHYAPDGQVIAGPAPLPLYSYKTHFNGTDLLTIDLVRFAFPITGQVVPVRNRLRIDFDSETGYNYEIRYKASMAQATWLTVPFSPTVEGAVNQSLIFGSGDRMSLYVLAGSRSGFYVVVRWKLLGA